MYNLLVSMHIRKLQYISMYTTILLFPWILLDRCNIICNYCDQGTVLLHVTYM